jgi:hypothetical protein
MSKIEPSLSTPMKLDAEAPEEVPVLDQGKPRGRGYLFHCTGRRHRTGYGLFQKAHKYSIRPITGLYAGLQ